MTNNIIREATLNASRSTPRANGKYRIDALAKGLAVLGLFSEQRTELRLSEIVDLLGIPMPTAFRIVQTLQQEDYVDKLTNGAYRPGMKVLTLGYAALGSLDLLQLAEAPLRRLVDQTGETVNLGVLAGDRLLYLVRYRNSSLVTDNIRVGSTLPAVYTSMGKMLLSELSDQALDARLSGASFPPGGPNAVRNIADLRSQLAEARARGYATQNEEVARGLRSIASAVRDGSGATVCAINIPISAVEGDQAGLEGVLKSALLETCGEISRRLEYRPSGFAVGVGVGAGPVVVG